MNFAVLGHDAIAEAAQNILDPATLPHALANASVWPDPISNKIGKIRVTVLEQHRQWT